MAGSPWGKIQHSTPIIRGIRTVDTAGHGGIMVSPKVAIERLSPEARDAALGYGGYYCYEEDCDWAIVAFEVPEVLKAMLGNKPWSEYGLMSQEYKTPIEYVRHVLATYKPDYLISRGKA